CLFAGHGFATVERHATQGRRWRFWVTAAPALLYGIVFSIFVALLQGDPFLDLKQAAQYLRTHSPKERVLTHQPYAQMVGPKTRFWSGLEKVDDLLAAAPRPGDTIMLSSYDMGSPATYNQLRDIFLGTYHAQVVRRFSRTALPLLPDIMEQGTYA